MFFVLFFSVDIWDIYSDRVSDLSFFTDLCDLFCNIVSGFVLYGSLWCILWQSKCSLFPLDLCGVFCDRLTVLCFLWMFELFYGTVNVPCFSWIFVIHSITKWVFSVFLGLFILFVTEWMFVFSCRSLQFALWQSERSFFFFECFLFSVDLSVALWQSELSLFFMDLCHVFCDSECSFFSNDLCDLFCGSVSSLFLMISVMYSMTE